MLEIASLTSRRFGGSSTTFAARVSCARSSVCVCVCVFVCLVRVGWLVGRLVGRLCDSLTVDERSSNKGKKVSRVHQDYAWQIVSKKLTDVRKAWQRRSSHIE